jgi:glycosyltransferase involved in cell wall biosynthesis
VSISRLPKIGFLLKTYPKVSETFILGEILGLEKAGLSLHIFSLQRPTDAVFHSATAAVRAPVDYVPAPSLRRVLALLGEHLSLACASPQRYVSALRFARRREEGGRLGHFLQAASLAAAVRKAGVTHLHAHFASEPTGVAELAGKFCGASYSISAHAKDIYLSSAKVLRRKLAGAEFTLTCTDYNRRYLESIAGADARVLRMYHGVDIERFAPTRAPDSTRSQPPLILSVGRLREKKGFPTLIEACARLVDQGVRFKCQIVGYGPDAAKLQGMIETMGLTHIVELVGKLTHEELIERYRVATAFVLPCQIGADGDRDGIPNVLLEAMAMEIPVVSTDVSGIPEVVEHGVNGMIVPPEDACALAASIATLIGDCELRARLGQAGRAIVARRFSNEANLTLVRDLLLRAARREPASSTTKASVQLAASGVRADHIGKPSTVATDVRLIEP